MEIIDDVMSMILYIQKPQIISDDIHELLIVQYCVEKEEVEQKKCTAVIVTVLQDSLVIKFITVQRFGFVQDHWKWHHLTDCIRAVAAILGGGVLVTSPFLLISLFPFTFFLP